jgi:hypothetical protein
MMIGTRVVFAGSAGSAEPYRIVGVVGVALKRNLRPASVEEPKSCSGRPQLNRRTTTMATAGQFTTGRFELAIDGHSLAVFSELQGISPVSHRNVAPVTLTGAARPTTCSFSSGIGRG